MKTNGSRKIAAAATSRLWFASASRKRFRRTATGGSATYSAESANALGYPQESTLFYPVLLYQQGFRFFNMGYASAMAMLLLAVAFAVTAFIVRNSRRFVHYQGGGR